MREDWIRKDVFEKVVLLKGLLDSTIPEVKKLDEFEYKRMMCHLAHYHCNNRQTLTEIEMLAYDTLIRNDVNPSTAYKWFCLTTLPKDFQHKLRTGRITQKQALRKATKRRRDKEIASGFEIMEMVRESIRRL